jgi:alkylresorcinol/alkylpyrone synthase
MEFTKAYPDKACLVVAVELCSLTFQKDDISKSNIIATSLFSDGCAAVLVAGDESKFAVGGKIKLLDSLSTIYYDSVDVMGWDVIENGFKVIFSRDIPTIVKDYVRPNIQELLDLHGIKVEDIKHYIAHPGGLKVINAYEESLGISNGAFDNSRKVLNEHGNMSSPSVLYVLKEFLMSNKFEKDEPGLISSLGPGFSSEILLFRTE